MKKLLISLSIFFVLLFVPMLAVAKGLVPDCNQKIVTDAGASNYGQFENPCDFDRIGELINTVINFLLVDFATPLAAIIFAYAGFLLITSSGNEHGKTKAKSIIKNVIIGYILALAAWLIINSILSTFLTPESMNWSFLSK